MEGFQSGAEVTRPRFIYGIKSARAMNRADLNPVMIISKECFKGIIGSTPHNR